MKSKWLAGLLVCGLVFSTPSAFGGIRTVCGKIIMAVGGTAMALSTVPLLALPRVYYTPQTEEQKSDAAFNHVLGSGVGFGIGGTTALFGYGLYASGMRAAKKDKDKKEVK